MNFHPVKSGQQDLNRVSLQFLQVTPCFRTEIPRPERR
jgi:hypothetical protein